MKEEVEEKSPMNYKAFFVIGIAFLPIGLSTDNIALTIVGAVFMVIGGLNKKKWNKEKKWYELTQKEKNMKIILLIGLLTLVFVGLAVLYINRAGNGN